MVDSFEDRTAEAVCTFAFCRGPGTEPILFQGRTEVRHKKKQSKEKSEVLTFQCLKGTIVRPRGPMNFGMWLSHLKVSIQNTYQHMNGRMGSNFRIPRENICRNGQGGKGKARGDPPPSLHLCCDVLIIRVEQNLPPIQGLGEIAAMASRGKYLIY